MPGASSTAQAEGAMRSAVAGATFSAPNRSMARPPGVTDHRSCEVAETVPLPEDRLDAPPFGP